MGFASVSGTTWKDVNSKIAVSMHMCVPSVMALTPLVSAPLPEPHPRRPLRCLPALRQREPMTVLAQEIFQRSAGSCNWTPNPSHNVVWTRVRFNLMM